MQGLGNGCSTAALCSVGPLTLAPNGLTLFFSILCIKQSVYLSMSFVFPCGHDSVNVHPSLSSPSFSSYCGSGDGDDDEVDDNDDE